MENYKLLLSHRVGAVLDKVPIRAWFLSNERVVTKIQGAGVLLPLPSESYATSQSRGWLILGLTGVGDFPRSERSNPAHFSASAKNGSFANTSDILSGNDPSSKSYDQYQAHIKTTGLGTEPLFKIDGISSKRLDWR